MKKVAFITALSLMLSALPASAAISDVTVEKGSLDRKFETARTLYYVTVDEELSAAPTISATGATVIQTADISSPKASKRVTILQDDETGTKYRFVINGNQEEVTIDEMSISDTGLLTVKYSSSVDGYLNITVFRPKADDLGTADKDETETSFGYSDIAVGDITDKVLLVKEVKGGFDKTFTYQLSDTDKGGMYTAYIGGKSIASANKATDAKYYLTDWTGVLADINAVSDEAGLDSFMNKYETKLNLDLTEYNGFADKSNYIGQLTGKGFTNKEGFLNALSEAEVLTRLNSTTSDKILTMLKENDDALGIDMSEGSIYDEVDSKSAVAAQFTSYQGLNSKKAIADAFNESVALVYLNEAEADEVAGRFDDVKAVAVSKELADRIDAVEASNPDKADVMWRSFVALPDSTDLADLATKLEPLVTEAEKTDPPKGDGGNGSTASGPSFIPGSLDKEEDETTGEPIFEPSEEIPVKIDHAVYTDLGNHKWAEEAILYLSDRKIVNGKGNRIFDPGAQVTREEFLKMLVLATELETKENKNPFTDVNDNAWYAPYIKVAIKTGITKGKSATVFGIGDPITRQEMAVMLQRAAKAAGISTTDKIDLVYFEDPFVDRNEMASWASSSITTLYKAGFISGVGNGRFAPNATATRAQAAQMIYNLIKGL